MDDRVESIETQNESTHLLANEPIVVTNNGSYETSKIQTGSSWYASVFLVINAALGAGLLNFPAAYDKSGGIVVAVIIQAILLVFIIGALLVLAYCSDVQRSATYQDVVYSMCGKRTQTACAISIVMYTFGTCITFFIIIGDQWDKFLMFAYGPDYCLKWYLSRKFTMITTCVILVMPLCFSRRIDFLKYPSFLGVFAVMYCVVLVTVKYFVSDVHPGTIKTRPSSITDVFIVVPVICFGYQCHVSVVPIYSCLKVRNLKEFSKTVLIAIFLCVITYTGTASFGYLTFGTNVQEDILLSYKPTTDVLIAVILIAAKMYTTYPILLFVGRTGVESLWIDLRNLRPEQIALGEKKRRYVIASSWFITSLILAVFIPNIGVVISALGELASLFIFVFPGLCLLQLLMRQFIDRRQEYIKYNFLLAMAIGYLVIGAFIFGESVTQTLWYDIKYGANKPGAHHSLCQ